MYDFKCQRCGECCRRYFIVSMPEEITAQARLKAMGMREFLDTHCQLFLQVFPRPQAGEKAEAREKPIVHRNLLPKKIAHALEKAAGPLPDHFVVLPMVCFKREERTEGNGKDGVNGGRNPEGACTFYTQDEKGLGGCSIYACRPLECRLFPFISMEKNADYSKLYPFCKGLRFRDEKLNYADLGFVHFRQTADYFRDVMERGFGAVWGQWPGRGVLLYKDRRLGEISEQEFFQAIAPYK